MTTPLPLPLLDSSAPKVQHAYEWSFIVLQTVGGQICLPLLLLTYIFFGSRGTNKARPLQRDPIVINFTITWIISSICYSLLLYWERSDSVLLSLDVTNSSLCLVQAALIPASQALTSTSTFFLVLNVWFAVVLGSSQTKPRSRFSERYMMILFLLLPYVVFLAFFVQAYLAGNHTLKIDINIGPGPPLYATTDNLAIATILYCVVAFTTTDNRIVPILPSGFIFSIILMGSTLLIEVTIIWQLRQRGVNGLSDGVYRPTLIRVIMFSLYRVFALGMLIGVAVKPDILVLEGVVSSGTFAAFADIVQGAAPLIVFLIFSTRTDVLKAWGIKKQTSSIEVIQGLDRERIFRADRYVPSGPKRLEEGPSTSLATFDSSDEDGSRKGIASKAAPLARIEIAQLPIPVESVRTPHSVSRNRFPRS